MKRLLALSIFLICLQTSAQKTSKGDTTVIKQHIDSINRLLDRSVVAKQKAILQKHYAADFVFTHGTGLIDSKASWVTNIMDTGVHYISREHDSTLVELHNNVAIVTGTLTVQRKRPQSISIYALRYVRVYALRNKIWQLISHRTTAEWHIQD
jgi:hypothetical protein